MAKMTITEALAEIKMGMDKAGKVFAKITPYLIRQSQLKDPLGEGNSTSLIYREKQSHDDLLQRVIKIQTAITQSNLTTSLTINSFTMSVSAWLVWKQKYYPFRKSLLESMWNHVQNARQLRSDYRSRLADNQQAQNLTDTTVSFDEKGILAELDVLNDTFARLDGQLSLLNATTVIDV